MFAGRRPTTIGVTAGKLSACPNKPNCVCSQIDSADKHYIAAIHYTGTQGDAMTRLKKIITEMPRTHIINESSNYLYAAFTSKLMGYVDDTEFLIDDAAKLIHVRSASRLGYRDFNMNRERVEAIRKRMGA